MATLTFDHFNKNILHLETDVTIDIQELYDKIKDEEDFPHISMTTPTIATATGKDDLGGGEFTAITLTLLNGWTLKSLTAPGSPTIIKVSGGNLIVPSGNFFTSVVNIHYDRGFSTAPAAIGLAAVLTSLTALQVDVTLIRKLKANRRKLDNVANTLTFYEDDQVTPLLVLDVTDFTGTPSVTTQAEADPQ